MADTSWVLTISRNESPDRRDTHQINCLKVYGAIAPLYESIGKTWNPPHLSYCGYKAYYSAFVPISFAKMHLLILIYINATTTCNFDLFFPSMGCGWWCTPCIENGFGTGRENEFRFQPWNYSWVVPFEKPKTHWEEIKVHTGLENFIH